MKKRTLLLPIAFFLSLSCTTHQHSDNTLAIMEIGRKVGSEFVYLTNNYGFLIHWIKNKPELYLYNKPDNKIEMIRDYDTFFVGLQAFPDGVKVDRIRGCGITVGKIPEIQKARLNQIINNKAFQMTGSDDGNYPVCLCESTYVCRFNKFISCAP